jgi:hypothetical protein
LLADGPFMSMSKAFSNEADTGWRQENASKNDSNARANCGRWRRRGNVG